MLIAIGTSDSIGDRTIDDALAHGFTRGMVDGAGVERRFRHFRRHRERSPVAALYRE